MPNVNLNDPKFFLEPIQDPIEKFNMFVRKWCPDASHLLDSDQNDGQTIRNMLESLAAQNNATYEAVVEAIPNPWDFVEPCEPDCSAVRHARHEAQWGMAARMTGSTSPDDNDRFRQSLAKIYGKEGLNGDKES